MTSSNISYDRAIAQYEETTAAVASQTLLDTKQNIITLSRVVPIVANNVIDLGDIITTVNLSGGAVAEIDIIVSANNFSVSKHYTLSCYWNSTSNAWRIATPSVDSGPFASNDFALDIRGNAYTTSLRLRRITGANTGTASIYLRLYGVDTVTWTETTTTSSVTAPTLYYLNAFVGQVGSKMVFGGDTTLYRAGTSALITDGSFQTTRIGVNNAPPGAGAMLMFMSQPNNYSGVYVDNTMLAGNNVWGSFHAQSYAGGQALTSNVHGDAMTRFRVDVAGRMIWGDGATIEDTNLYRSAISTLKTDGALNVNGIFTTSYTRVLPVVVGNAIDILNFTASAGVLDISITSASSGNVHSKVYHVPFVYHGTANFWYMVIPTADYGPYSGNDFALDMNSNLGTHYLRLRRTAGTTAETVKVDIVFHTIDGATYTPTTATTTSTTAAGDWQSSSITQTGGKLVFGSAADTNLYRGATDALRTDDTFQALRIGVGVTPNTVVPIASTTALDGNSIYAENTFAGGNSSWGSFHARSAGTIGKALSADVTGDTNRRFYIGVDGVMLWGSGAASLDTNFFRSAADTLKTDDSLIVSANMAIGTDTPSSSYRLQINNGTNDVYGISLTSTVVGGSTIPHIITQEAAAGGMILASHVAAESFRQWQVYANGKQEWGPGSGVVDTNLYRSAADALKTDDTFQTLRLGVGTVAPGAGGPIISVVQAANTQGIFVDNTLSTGNNVWGNFTAQVANVGGQALVAQVVGDANSRFLIRADGYQTWGSGTATQDTNLYRSAADTLKTDDSLLVHGHSIVDDYFQCLNMGAGTTPVTTVPITASTALDGVSVYAVNTLTGGGNSSWGSFHAQSAVAGGMALSAQVVSDTNKRLMIGVNGIMSWGSGTAALDTNLHRNSAGELKTDAVFTVGTYLNVGNNLALAATNGAIYWGPSLDVNLYRSGADSLKTDDSLNIIKNLYMLNDTAGTAQIWFGASADTNLYRSAANELKTDDSFVVAGDFSITGQHNLSGLTRTVPTTVNNTVDIGTFTSSTNGAYILNVQIVVDSSGFSVSKVYSLPVNYNQSAGAWQIAQPISDTGGFFSNDFALDVKTDLVTSSLRIRRTAGSTTGVASISIQITNATGTVAVAYSTATASVTAPTTYTADAFLSQIGGQLTFGSDTNLYRSSANVLKTDDTFNAVAGVQVNGTSVLDRSTHTGTQTSSTISDFNSKIASLAGGVTDYIFTSETTTSTTYTNLATVGPTITMPNLIAGQLVLVIFSAIASVTTGGIAHSANMGYAVSGVETLAAGLPNIISTHNSDSHTMEQTTLYIVGTSGSHTFQAKYNTTSGDTATFLNRRITAVAVG